MKPFSHPARGRDLDWTLGAHGVSHSQTHWLVSSVKPHDPVSFPQALNIRISCCDISLLFAASQSNGALGNESCAPQATLQSVKHRQSQGQAVTGTVSGAVKRVVTGG